MLLPDQMSHMGCKFQPEALLIQPVQCLQDTGLRLRIHKQTDRYRRNIQFMLNGKSRQHQIRFQKPYLLLFKIRTPPNDLYSLPVEFQYPLFAHARKNLVMGHNHNDPVFSYRVHPLTGSPQMQGNEAALHISNPDIQLLLQIAHDADSHLKYQRIFLLDLFQKDIFQDHLIFHPLHQSVHMDLQTCCQVFIGTKIHTEHFF